MGTESDRLAGLSEAVRESSIKRLGCVAPGDEEWRPAANTLSFVDVLKHLVDADAWLLDLLKGHWPPRAVIEPGEASAGQWNDLMEALIDLGSRKASHLRSLTREQLAAPIDDPEVCGRVESWWLIARANLDHEIHHRGALQLTLRLCYGDVRRRR